MSLGVDKLHKLCFFSYQSLEKRIYDDDNDFLLTFIVYDLMVLLFEG